MAGSLRGEERASGGGDVFLGLRVRCLGDLFLNIRHVFRIGETVDPEFTRESMSQLASSIPLASRKAEVLGRNWLFFQLVFSRVTKLEMGLKFPGANCI